MSGRSLGETEVLIQSQIVGKVRVLEIAADQAIFPRLAMTLGLTLNDQQAEQSPVPAPGKFEMRDATGELRLLEQTESVGAVSLAGPRRYARSSNYGGEDQLRFTCDLDHQRLELIERRRAGGPLILWLQLWPTLTAGTQYLDCRVQPIMLKIPREDWLAFYTNVGGGYVDVIEVQYSPREAEQFKRALIRLQEARSLIQTGAYDEAVARCRHALDAFGQEIESSGKDPIKALLERATHTGGAKEFVGIAGNLRQLTNLAHHELGKPMTYSRAEAQFVVRTTESLLTLLGRLAQDDPNA